MRLMKQMLFALLIGLVSTAAQAATYYISPGGDGGKEGKGTNVSPFMTFANAISHMKGGDTLVLLDGTYTGNGNGNVSGIPAGTALSPTVIQAKNRHAAVLDSITVTIAGADYITIDGLKLKAGAGATALTIGASDKATAHITVKNTGVYKSAHSGAEPAVQLIGDTATRNTTHCLLEDCWFYGRAKNILEVRYTQGTTLRRCVVRHDGGEGHRLAISSIYTHRSTDGILENCIVLDTDPKQKPRVKGIFIQGPTSEPYDTVQVLGCIALDTYSESSTASRGMEVTGDTGAVLTNCIVWKTPRRDGGYSAGFSVAKGEGKGVTPKVTLSHCTSKGWGFGVLGDPHFDAVQSTLIMNTYHHVLGGIHLMEYCYMMNSESGEYEGNITQGPSNAWKATATQFVPKYIARIDDAAVKGTGHDGGDRGANIVYRYVDGKLTGDLLWPWPNEEFIKADFHNLAEGARGKWYENQPRQSFTQYIWEYAGSPSPWGSSREDKKE